MNNNHDEMYNSEFIEIIGNPAVNIIKKNLKSKKRKLHCLRLDVSYQSIISNSHNCPKNGMTNWHHDANKPSGYPGWEGRIWLIFDKDISGSFGGDLLQGSGLHSGTGGYGYYDLDPSVYIRKGYEKEYPLSWSVKIFEEDFQVVNKFKTIQLLTNEPMKKNFIYHYDINQED